MIVCMLHTQGKCMYGQGGFHHRTVFKRLCWRPVHAVVSALFPKGQGIAVAGVYECLDCKAIGKSHCFRGFDPGAIKQLPDVVRVELYDQWVITPKWIAERSLVNRVRIERDNTHDFGPVLNVLNEEKVCAYWDLTDRFFYGTALTACFVSVLGWCNGAFCRYDC